MKDFNKLWQKLEKYDYISFDIFDTLIKRNVASPRDVFKIVENRYNSKNKKKIPFYKMRVEAEKQARLNSNSEEITLEEIYYNINLIEDVKVKLKELEIKTELEVCIPNYQIQSIYQQCLKNNKRVIITSDMYLSEEIIKKILINNGYSKFYKLYLSSEVKLQKHTGNLYTYLLSDLNISKKSIIHIGDNKRADILSSFKKGINSYYISRSPVNTNFVTKKDIYKTERSPYIFINNMLWKYRTESEMFRWGYEAYGPLILGFCQYVHKLYSQKKIEKLYFLARDMHIIINVYKKLYPNDTIEYLEVSRRSLRRAYVLSIGDINGVFDTMARKSYTLLEVLKSLDINSSTVTYILEKEDISLSMNQNIRKYSYKEYQKINEIILKILKSDDNLTIDYLIEKGFFEYKNIGIVDIGWHGTIQNMLEVIAKKRVKGIYFGSTKRKSFLKQEAYGYWFDTEDEFSILPQLTMISILEVMLFPKIGTTLGYKKNSSNKIIPIHKETETDDSFKTILSFQNGGIKFVFDYITKSPYQSDELSSKIATLGYEKLAFTPTKKQAKKLGILPYEEGGVIKIAGARSIFYYLFNWKMFIRDYKTAKWKTGFIKQICPFLFNPQKIDVFIKRISNKNKLKRRIL